MPKILSLLLLLTLLSSCGTLGYSVSGSKVTYGVKDQGMIRETELPGVDAASFEVLSKRYGRDKARVYRCATLLEGADPKTFELLGDGTLYARDAQAVWVNSRQVSRDPEHFEILTGLWSKDSKQVFFSSDLVSQAQAATFQPIEGSHYAGKDEQHVFWRTKVIPGADPQSYELLKGEYARDKNQAMRADKVLEGAVAADFTTPNKYFGHDKSRVFYNGFFVEEADAATAQFLDEPYFKDANHVFYGNKPMLEADPETFKTYRDPNLRAEDKNHKYAGPNILK